MKMKSYKNSVFARLLKAHQANRGMRLSAEDVDALLCDHAVASLAWRDLSGESDRAEPDEEAL